MIKVIRRLLEDIINNIDAGNSNLSEEEYSFWYFIIIIICFNR